MSRRPLLALLSALVVVACGDSSNADGGLSAAGARSSGWKTTADSLETDTATGSADAALCSEGSTTESQDNVGSRVARAPSGGSMKFHRHVPPPA